MSIILPALPFQKEALEPYISRETVEFHYEKHHRGYVNKLNELIPGTQFEKLDLLTIVTHPNATGPIFNNAAQVLNHNFYWDCLTPNQSSPKPALLTALEKAFGSFDAFKAQFSQVALNTFGSGWAWLVKEKEGALKIVSTSNAGNPLLDKKIPLLTCDVWEHAYYIDYRNARAKYIEHFWHLVNWSYVFDNFNNSK